MGIPRTSYAVSLLLAVSTVISLAILGVDDVLWGYGRPHAYGLAGFTAITLLLIGVVLFRPRGGMLLAGLWGLIELAILTGNLFVGAQFGVLGFSQAEFTEYLTGVALTYRISSSFGFWKISPYTYDVLLAVQALIAIVGLAGYMRMRSQKKTEPISKTSSTTIASATAV